MVREVRMAVKMPGPRPVRAAVNTEFAAENMAASSGLAAWRKAA